MFFLITSLLIGVAINEEAFDEALDWTEEQEDAFVELYEKDESLHSLVERKLAEFARSKDLLSQL